MAKLIVDYNQIIIANIYVGINTFGQDEITFDMVRHLFLNNLLALKKKFSKYDEVILACDGKNSWRREVFPYYKAKRKEARAESPLDWAMIFEHINRLREELKEFFPYRVIHVDSAEGDDCIATIVKYLQANELIQNGLEESTQDIMIVSSDNDFVQLQKFPNVDQYASVTKKFVRSNDPENFLLEHIIKAGDDGIPNILSDDDTFVDPDKKQVMMTAKRFAAVKEAITNQDWNNPLLTNYKRNKVLIDLINEIPESVSTQIVEQYISQANKDRSKMLGYFVSNRLKNLMSDINNF